MGRFDASKTAPKRESVVNRNVSGQSRYPVAVKALELRVEESHGEAIQDDDVTIRTAIDGSAKVTIALTL